MEKKINLDPLKEGFNLFIFENFNAGIDELKVSNLLFKKMENIINETI